MHFPFFALITPVITSVLFWLVTGSAYTLLFALLGPVMGVAQYVDAKRRARKEESLKEERESEESLARTQLQQLEVMAMCHEASLANPPSSRFADSEYRLRPRWAAGEIPQSAARAIRLGINQSGAMPVLVDITKGLSIAGSEVETQSVMRAISFQLAWMWGTDESSRVALSEASAARSPSSQAPLSVTAAKSKTSVPYGVRYFLQVDRGIARLHDTIDPTAQVTEMQVDLLSRAEASLIREKLCAESQGTETGSGEIPVLIPAVLNTENNWESTRESLVVNVGRSSTHPVLLDLVAAGPHAVITGMTGSGKTEFLRTWLISMTASYSPEDLSILVIDFKGGAGFTQLAQLPHVVGVVTDLDHSEALRAMTSLKAELLFRERFLAENNVTDISQLRTKVALPRLLVVIDEYRAVLETFPELVNTFVDLTARGRALGVHAIVSSQRVGGPLGDSLLANCAVRVGLRVAQKQDSQNLLGNDAAFLLPHVVGRAVVMGTGLEQREFQAAQISQPDLERVVAKSQKWCELQPQWKARSPWLPPLSNQINFSQSPEAVDGVAWLGLTDIPQQQLQSWAQYSPVVQGNLLITGPARSGVTNTLHTLSRQLGVPLTTDAEQAWDVVVEGKYHSPVLVLDDLDGQLEEFDLEHRDQFVSALTRIARRAPKDARAVIIGCSEHIRGVSALLELFPEVVTLCSAVQPGRAQWQGHEIQIIQERIAFQEKIPTAVVTWDPDRSYVVITQRKRDLLASLEQRARSRVSELSSELSVTTTLMSGIYVGTPDEWMSRMALLSALRSDAVLVLDNCTTSELRALRLRSGLFPHYGQDKTLVVELDGSTTRVVI